MCFRPAAIELDRHCPACNATGGADDKACPECGAELPEEASPYFVPGADGAGMPAAPGAPGAPGAPKTPGAPGMPAAPGAPGAPAAPGVPKAPGQ